MAKALIPLLVVTFLGLAFALVMSISQYLTIERQNIARARDVCVMSHGVWDYKQGCVRDN